MYSNDNIKLSASFLFLILLLVSPTKIYFISSKTAVHLQLIIIFLTSPMKAIMIFSSITPKLRI